MAVERRRIPLAVFLFLIIVFISFTIILVTDTKVLSRYKIPSGSITSHERNSTHLMANVSFIDDSSSRRTNKDGCSRILLYDTELIDKDTGVGHRLASYSLASAVAATTDSALVLLEPPLNSENKWTKSGGSPFGCPTFMKNEMTDMNEACGKLPTGLSRIIRVPEILSRGCNVPFNVTCTILKENRTSLITSYKDWSRISTQTLRQNGFPEVTCKHNNSDSNMTVLAIGGYQLKYYWIDRVRPRLVQRLRGENDRKKKQRTEWEKWMKDWSIRMGATVEEVHEYTRANGIINNKKDEGREYVEDYGLIDYLNAILNRAEVPMFQRWVVNDIAKGMKQIDLPQSSFTNLSAFQSQDIEEGYDAMHIRRGDSLTTSQSILATEEYWVQRGYATRMNKTNDIATLSMYPTNYVPFNKYWEEYVSHLKDCNQWNATSSIRKIYIATDDITTVKIEIANLTATNDELFWTVCNKSVEFVFNNQEEHTTHLHQHLVTNTASINGDNITTTIHHDQYSRALTALVDLQILARSEVFVGDVRSYFTRLLMMLRTSFQKNRAYTRHIVIAWGGSSNDKLPPWK